jgi:hypothetical protein
MQVQSRQKAEWTAQFSHLYDSGVIMTGCVCWWEYVISEISGSNSSLAADSSLLGRDAVSSDKYHSGRSFGDPSCKKKGLLDFRWRCFSPSNTASCPRRLKSSGTVLLGFDLHFWSSVLLPYKPVSWFVKEWLILP